MKRLILLASFFFCLFIASSQTNTLDSAWVRDNYYKWERMVPMRDGKKKAVMRQVLNDFILCSVTCMDCDPFHLWFLVHIPGANKKGGMVSTIGR